MQVLKSLFPKKDTTKNPEQEQKFDHSKVTSNDASQCPFMKKQSANKMTQQSKKTGQCPYKGKDQTNKTKKKSQKQVDSSSDEEEAPRGGCPFMGASDKKKNPGLAQSNSAYDQIFVSKFNYYLSANKIDFSLLKRKNKGLPQVRTRQVFNKYPIYLKHTLFYQGEDYQKVRQIQCCSRFLPYEKLRQKGNKYYNKGKYYEALDYYERALSLFKWLQHYEEEKTQTMSVIKSEQSIQESQNMSVNNDSKIKIQLENQEDDKLYKDTQMDEMQTKYKQFFVIYDDLNVRVCNGEQMDETADIDMRKSLMLQVYLNMSATYMQLNHFSLALQCVQDMLSLTDKCSQIYLRKAQALLLNKGLTLAQANEAKKCMQTAFQLKKSQKIFQSNPNILKLVNLQDADEVYLKTLKMAEQKILQKEKDESQIKNRIYERAKEIKQIQDRLITQGKKPYERNQDPMPQSMEFKILERMRQKYIRVIEFYTEGNNKEQIILAKNQLQQLLRVFAQINNVLSAQITQKDNQLGGIKTQKIQKRIDTIKKNYCEDIYNSGKFNFTVMEWAIKEIVKQERQQKELKKKRQQQEKRMNGQVLQQKDSMKNNLLKKASWGLILIPIAGMLISNFLI